MPRNTWRVVIPFVLVCALAVAGCSKGKENVPATSATETVEQTQKPLVIPKSFADSTAKLQFAVTATDDGYYKEAAPLLKEALAEKPDAQGYARLGTASYNLKDFAGAIEAWTEAAKLDSRLAAETKNNIGNALRDSDKLEEAAAAYQEALKLDPKFWTASVNLAYLHKLQGNMDEAIKVLEKAVAENSNVKTLTDSLELYKEEAKPKG